MLGFHELAVLRRWCTSTMPVVQRSRLARALSASISDEARVGTRIHRFSGNRSDVFILSHHQRRHFGNKGERVINSKLDSPFLLESVALVGFLFLPLKTSQHAVGFRLVRLFSWGVNVVLMHKIHCVCWCHLVSDCALVQRIQCILIKSSVAWSLEKGVECYSRYVSKAGW